MLQRSVDTVDGAFTGETSRVWIVIMTQIACGLMTANGAILPEERLAPLLRNSPDLPDGADGLSPDMYVFLSEMRDGARMHRDWPKREYRHTTPTNSQYRVANPEVTSGVETEGTVEDRHLRPSTAPRRVMLLKRLAFGKSSR